MKLGKRPRPPMKRTTSITEFTMDLNMESPLPSDNNPIINNGHVQKSVDDDDDTKGWSTCTRRKPVVVDGGGGTGIINPEGFDERLLISRVSPRNSSKDFVETPHFLRACGLCKRRLAPGRDIYMYRGDTAFCSLECRQQQMNQDERKEKCSLESNKEAASTIAAA